MANQALHVAHGLFKSTEPILWQGFEIAPGLVSGGRFDWHFLDVKLLKQLSVVLADKGHESRVKMPKV